MYSNELAHHGTKGMKWGVRRFQNKDGSLTPAGRKRYDSLEDAVGAVKAYHIKAKRKRNLKKAREAAAAKRVSDAEAKAKAEQRAKDVAEGKVSARKMTSEELQSRIDKLNLEKRYKQLMEETNPSSRAQSVGKTFIKKMWNEAVQPAAAEAGKAVLKDVLIKQLRKNTGLDIDDKSLDALNKEWKELDLKKKISDAKKGIYDNDKHMKGEDTDDDLTKLEKEARKAKAESTIATSKKVVNETNKYFDNEKAKEDIKADAQKQVDEYNANNRESSYSKKGKDIIDNVLYTRTSPDENIKDGRLLTDSNVKSTEVSGYSSRGKDVLDSVLDKDGNFITYVRHNDELAHFGIKGMKWGIRRFQNKDGSLTPVGKKKYSDENSEKFVKEDDFPDLDSPHMGRRYTPSANRQRDEQHKRDLDRRRAMTEKESDAELKKIMDDIDKPNGTFKKLDDEIRNYSGDWYNSNYVSDGFKNHIKNSLELNDERDKLKNTVNTRREELTGKKFYFELTDRDKKTLNNDVDYTKLNSKLNKVNERIKQNKSDCLGVVLTDLGYKDTPTSRELIRDMVFWD